MKRLFVLAVFLGATMTGCVSLPAPVDDALLAEKTAEESSRLAAVEKSIIEKHKSKNDARMAMEESVRLHSVDAGRLGILKNELDLLKKKEKQYTLEKDDAKKSETAKSIGEKSAEITRQNARVAYQKAFMDEQTARYEVAEAELSALVAERGYERSRIARAYQDRKVEKEGIPKKKVFFGLISKDGRVDVDRYKKYVESQKSQLNKKTQKQKIATERLEEAKKNLR